MIKNLRKNKKGFTLVEIIVVIVILAVLMAVAVPSVMKYVNEADNAKLMAEARAVMTTSQAEVLKQVVSSDGLTAEELGHLKDETQTNSIAKIAGVDCDVTQLYKSVDMDTATNLPKDTSVAIAAGGKDEVKAVTMTFGSKTVTAVLNDKVYVAE